jgi:hypothetical protein
LNGRPGEGVDGDGVGNDAADVAERDVGLGAFEEAADAVGEPGQVRAPDRALDREDEAVHLEKDRGRRENSSAGRAMSSGALVSLTLRQITVRRKR